MGFFYPREPFRQYWTAVEAMWRAPFYDAIVAAFEAQPKCLQACCALAAVSELLATDVAQIGRSSRTLPAVEGDSLSLGWLLGRGVLAPFLV